MKSKCILRMTREMQSAQNKRAGVNVDKVQSLVCLDRSVIVQPISAEMNTNKENIQHILTEDLGMRKYFEIGDL